MKKHLKQLIVVLVAFFILTGCFGPKPPEGASDLIANAQIQMGKKKSMTSQSHMVLSIGLMDQEVTVTTVVTASEVFKDKAAETHSTTTIETSLKEAPASPLEIQTYIRANSDQETLLDVYTKTQDSDWEYLMMDAGSLPGQGRILAPKDMTAFIGQYIDKLQLSEEIQGPDDQKVYVLEGSLPGTDLAQVVDGLTPPLDAGLLLPEIQLQIRAVFDGKSQVLQSVTVSIPETTIEDETIGQVSLAMEMDYQISAYNEVKSISIPEEALAKSGK